MKIDGRALDHATLTELRKRGVTAVQSPAGVAAALGVNLRTLFCWLALYRRGGWGQLEAGKRGGRPPEGIAKLIDTGTCLAAGVAVQQGYPA